MPNVVIRDARPDEAETLLAIQRAAGVAAFAHVFPPELYPFPDQAVRMRWQQALEDRDVTVRVAEVGGRAAGLSATRPDWLDGLYVLPEHWGTGVADALHDDALARLRSLGSDHATLWTLEENRRGRRFYERRGWRLNGETRVVPFPPNPLDVGYTIEL